MTTNPAAAQLLAVGISKEASYGVGAAPTLLLPVSPPSVADTPGWGVDGGWRVAPAVSFGRVVTSQASALTLAGDLFPDGIGFALAGVLGDVGFAAGTPNVWTMALLNSGAQQPPSYQVVVADPTGQLSYAGCKVAALTIGYDPDALLSWSADLVGQPGAVSAWTMPGPGSELPVAGWRGVATIGGTLQGGVMSASVALTRGVTAKRNVTGMLAPALQRSELLSVSGQITVVAQTDSFRQQANAGTVTSIDLAFSYGVGAAQRALTLHCSTAYLSSVVRSYGNKWIELDIGFDADANTTDVGASGGWSPIKATLKNAVASGVYA